MANITLNVTAIAGADGTITITIPSTGEKATYTVTAGQIVVKDTHVAHILAALKGTTKA